MYYLHTIKDTVSISPRYMGEDITKAVEETLRNKYERTMDRDMGIVLAVFNVRDISDGRIMPEDPNTHHDVVFDILTFSLEVEEVVIGEVSELVDFGCFVRVGPLDGLVHLSQITTDFVNYDRKTLQFVSRNSGKSLKKGDVVYAKVSTISMRSNLKDTKIALTMRPDGLGKPEWVKESKSRERRAMRGRAGGGRPGGGKRK